MKVLDGSSFLVLAGHFDCLLDTAVRTVWVYLRHWDRSNIFLEDGLSRGNEDMVQMVWESKVSYFGWKDHFFPPVFFIRLRQSLITWPGFF